MIHENLSADIIAMIDHVEEELKANGIDIPDINADADIVTMHLADQDRVNHLVEEYEAVEVVEEPPTIKPAKKTKKEQAIIIFNDLWCKGHGRKVTIQRFQDVIGMTPACASVYYQKIRSGEWS